MQTPDSMNITMEEVMDKKLTGAMKEIHKIIDGTYRGCIVAINPGLGCEFTIVNQLKENNVDYHHFPINSFSPVEFYKILGEFNDENKILLLTAINDDTFNVIHYKIINCILNDREKKDNLIVLKEPSIPVEKSTLHYKGKIIIVTKEKTSCLDDKITNKDAIIDMRL